MSSKKSSGSSSTWDTLEPIVTFAGKWAWIYGIIAGVIYIITAILSIRAVNIAKEWWSLYGVGPYTGPGYGVAVWQFINAAVLIVVSILWVRPKFSVPCGEKEWEKLLSDVLVLGNVQIPWMLIMGVLLEIFGYGWGGLVVLVCALLIIFLGPRKFEWNVK
ncbi:MAG: hypothetical protein JW776_16180 [Candidatus Lokiarchaeota archaeon]|nr:hypothetical protein [Candidatus Lokiarchaeota archaeon]